MPSSYALPPRRLATIPDTPPPIVSTSGSETAANHQFEHSQDLTPPHTHTRPPRAIPPTPLYDTPGPRKISFDPIANRRYFSAPYSLPSSSAALAGTAETGRLNEKARHISLTLGEYGPSQEERGFMPKGRPRGESDLSRPNGLRGSGKSNGFLSLGRRSDGHGDGLGSLKRHGLPTELLTAILLPLPYLLSSLLNAPETRTNHIHHSSNLEAAEEILEEVASTALPVPTSSSSLIHACALTAGTLLLVGLIGRLLHSDSAIDKRKGQDAQSAGVTTRTISTQNVRRLLLRMVTVGLPFLATVEIGGVRTGMILLCAVATNLISPDPRAGDEVNVKTWKRALKTRRWTCAVFVLSLLADVLWLRTDAEPANLVRGYVALGKSVLFLQPPLPTSLPQSSKMTAASSRSSSLTSVAGAGVKTNASWEASQTAKEHDKGSVSVLVCSSEDTNYTLAAGAVLGVITVLVSALLNVSPSIGYMALLTSSASIGSATALYYVGQPLALRSRQMTGFALGLSACALFGLVFGLRAPLSGLALTGAALFSYAAVRMDLGLLLGPSRQHDHSTYTKKTHEHEHTHVETSATTVFLLRRVENFPLVHSVLLDRESRHIVYFMFINLAFMFIQGVYAYLSGSLGLFSDTIHMFFDCAGLLVGLIAAVMSKWPPSVKYPYGYGKIETLSGLGNGIFLMFVSVEIIYESFERLFEGQQLQHVSELLLVSIGGLAVNLIGLKFIGHAHHGHGHSHSHDHSHAHDHESEHNHTNHNNGHQRTTSIHHHHAGHSNENMAGIYLHILADTMGSVAVIISSLLTLTNGWSGWDPIASCIIAILIIAASYPLVVGSAKRLLLTVPSEVEWRVRGVLGELSSLRGVAGYAVPRFWLEDADEEASHAHHGHDHKHEHQHKHEHDGECDHKHDHRHDSANGHSHTHSHAHSHDHDHHHNHNHEHNHSHGHEHTPPHTHTHNHSPSPSISLTSSPGTPTLPITPLTPMTLSHPSTADKIHGVIHVIASASADVDDVRRRVEAFLREKNMDVLVHVDREGEGRCWCQGDVGGVNGEGRRGSVVVM